MSGSHAGRGPSATAGDPGGGTGSRDAKYFLGLGQIESSTRGARHGSQKPVAVLVQFAAKIEAAKASQVMAEVTLARSCP